MTPSSHPLGRLAATGSVTSVRSIMPRFTTSFLLLLLLSPWTQAALVFEKTTVTLDPKTPAAHLDTEFAFKNDGATPTTVLEVSSSCGCTVPALEKKTYAASEKGILKVGFDAGDRQGPQNRTVTLRTDAGTQVLTLIVNLPVRSVLTPRLHFFRPPDTGGKDTLVTYSNDLPVTLDSVTSSDPVFTVTSVAEKEGAVYKITAKLASTPATAARATVLVRSHGASGASYLDTYYLRYAPAEIPPAPAQAPSPAPTPAPVPAPTP